MNTDHLQPYLMAARAGEGPQTCICGCGVLWHTAPATDPCCRDCRGYVHAEKGLYDRAARADATIARVRALCDEAGAEPIHPDDVRVALDGEA